MRIALIVGAGIALLCASAAAAQSPAVVGGAIAAGQIGERYDGYMGAVSPISPELRRQVNAVNLRRRNLYIQLGARRRVTAEVVGLTAACELIRRLSAGEAYMLQDGAWRRKEAHKAVALPDYCR